MKYDYREVPVRGETVAIIKHRLEPVYGDMGLKVLVEVNCAYRDMQQNDTVFATMSFDHTFLRHLGCARHALAAPEGRSMSFYRVCDFRSASAEEQAEALLRDFDSRMSASRDAMEIIVEDMTKVDPAILADLPDLGVKVDWASHPSYIIGARWTGLSAALRPARLHEPLNKFGSLSRGKVAKGLLRLAKQQAHFRKTAGTGLTMDPVLHATLTRLGIDVEGFVEDAIERLTVQLAERGTPGAGPIDAAGVRFFWNICQGHVTAKYDLAPGVSWTGNAVVLRGTTIPETVRSSLGGQPVERVVGHPDLAGYDIASIADAESAKKGPTTTMMVRATRPAVVLGIAARDLPLAA